MPKWEIIKTTKTAVITTEKPDEFWGSLLTSIPWGLVEDIIYDVTLVLILKRKNWVNLHITTENISNVNKNTFGKFSPRSLHFVLKQIYSVKVFSHYFRTTAVTYNVTFWVDLRRSKTYLKTNEGNVMNLKISFVLSFLTLFTLLTKYRVIQKRY